MKESLNILKNIVNWYYRTQFRTQEKKPVAYLSAFAPVELLRGIDIICLYPENQAVVYAASGKGRAYLRNSFSKRYSINLCGYARTYLGSLTANQRPRGLPPPDFLIGSNNQCGTIHYWFAHMGRKFDAPVFLLDYPSMESKNSFIEEYVTKQHRSLIEFVTKRTGHTFDEPKFLESIKFSSVACEYWQKIQELRKEMPCRVYFTDLTNEMLPLVVAKGTKLAADYYKALYYEKREAPLKGNEDFRILWYGYPLWFHKDRIPSELVNNCVMDTYTTWWVLNYGKAPNFRTLSKIYRNTYLNRTVQERKRHLLKLMKQYNIDGVVIHVNRSCKRDSIGVTELKKSLYERSVPCLSIEADMMDEEAFSKSLVSNKIETFIEILTREKQ